MNELLTQIQDVYAAFSTDAALAVAGCRFVKSRLPPLF